MTKPNYIIALLLTICVIFAVISARNTQSNRNILLELKNDFRGIFERYKSISSTIDRNIQQLDELARENERLQMENAALRDMIEAFDMDMERKYDFEGHQSRYMEGVR